MKAKYPELSFLRSPMKPRRHAFLCLCLLVILTLFGCSTFRRDRFLTTHSLDRLLADRPQAAKLLEQHPALAQWLRTEWNRPIVEYRLYWSDDMPSVSTADHGFMPEYKLIRIRIAKNQSPEDQLTALVFEICNAQEFADIENWVTQATAGKITRDDYIHKKSVKEHQTVLKVGNIVRSLLVLSSSEASATNLYRHLLAAPSDFNEYHAWNSRIPNSNYLRTLRYYGEEYDRIRKRAP